MVQDDVLDIHLFGQGETILRGQPLPPLHSRRGFWLLALLALRPGRPITRSSLAGLLWPESDESTALHNLRQTLSDLRRALGARNVCIVADPGRSLRLDTSRARVDVSEFDAACADGS